MSQATCKLRNGQEVTAKMFNGKLEPVTYSNRTQAEKAAAKLGAGWKVYQFTRPFYVGKVEA
jgi:hypothetical protein